MYAVIKTGGKQYRVQPGDLMVVEKLEGEPGAAVSFGEVLMLGGDGAAITLGAPMVEGASVAATLIETRKGEKLKIFKKIRRQGYRRTRGHRQFESVLRVTGISGAGSEAKWDGEVSLTTKAELDARARGLPFVAPQSKAQLVAAMTAETPAKKAAPKKAKTAEEVVADPEVQAAMAEAETNIPAEAAADAEAPAKKAAPKKAAAPKKSKDDGATE
ncbi:MAG: rplU [Phenylobacterium sp.]|nr:rplU [Phenylobacterium sp.]